MNAALAALILGRAIHSNKIKDAKAELDRGIKDDATAYTINGMVIENYGLSLKKDIERGDKAIKEIDEAIKILKEHDVK